MPYRKTASALFVISLIAVNLYAVALAQDASAISWKHDYLGLHGWRRALVAWVDWNGAWLHGIALLPAASFLATSMWRHAMSRPAAVFSIVASAMFVSICLVVRNIAYAPFTP